MKKIFLSIAIVCAVGFTVKKDNSDNSAAVANQLQGVFLFTDCKPAAPYKVLGTVKSFMSFGSGQYTAVRNKLLTECKKKFPNATGLIFHFNDGGIDTADAIIFQ